MIRLEAPSFGRRWPVTIEVGDMDPQSRWIDFRVSLPFGVVNEEHITLIATEEGGTGVRFNFHLPPGWRGRLVALSLGRELRRGPEQSLRDLIRVAEIQPAG